MKKKVVIVGFGGMGQALEPKLQKLGLEVIVATRVGVPFDELLVQERPIAVFLAIPTADCGEAALGYILACIRAGIPVITCEKGSFAYHAAELMPHRSLIGYRAVAGGGSELIPYTLGLGLNGDLIELNAVLNASWNYYLTRLAQGIPEGQVILEMIGLTLLEPAGAAASPLERMNGENRDFIMKACGFFNLALADDRFVTPGMLGDFQLTQDELDRLKDQPGRFRLMASFSTYPKDGKDFFAFGKGFDIVHPSGWSMAGGFRIINPDSPAAKWLPDGKGNAVQAIVNGVALPVHSGPGAGYDETSNAMIKDFREQCKL